MISTIEKAKPIIQELNNCGLNVVEQDLDRPWGGFLKIDDKQATRFITKYFDDLQLPDWAKSMRMDPKILLVKPNTRLSWQYHDRRGEMWRVVQGVVGVLMSQTDVQPDSPLILNEKETIEIPQGTRHRLVGQSGCWGVVAEIWVSTDPSYPTDEDDNHRLSDDFGRT